MRKGNYYICTFKDINRYKFYTTIVNAINQEQAYFKAKCKISRREKTGTYNLFGFKFKIANNIKLKKIVKKKSYKLAA